MNILFDAGIMNGNFVGIAKSTWYLYDNCHRLCEDFHAYGFNTRRIQAGKENLKRFDWDVSARNFLEALGSLMEN